MTDLSEAQVLEYVTSLQMETETLRLEAEDDRQNYGMYRIPLLPKDLRRREPVYILSPDVMHEEKEIRSLLMTFQTEVKNLPLERNSEGVITETIQKGADKLERAAAIFLSRLDPDRDIKESRYWRQMVTPLAINILELLPIESANPAERFCWRLLDVEPDGCGWLEEGGNPTVFGRQYQQFIFTTEEMSRRKDGPEGPGAVLAWGGKDGNKRGEWDWVASDDFTSRQLPPMGSNKMVERATMAWLDDGQMIYLVALNRGNAGLGFGGLRLGAKKPTGKLVWKGPNPFGRSSAFLTPGNKTPQRQPNDHYLPYLQELLTVTEQQGVIDSTRASAARNRAAPRHYVDPEPESMKEYIARNNGAMPPPVVWAEDGSSPYILGEVKEKPITIDPDLEKLDARLEARRERYAHGALSTLRDPQVVKDSTAAAYIGAWDSSITSLAPVLGGSDRTDRHIIEAWEHSIKWIAKQYGPQYAKFEMLAVGGERIKGKPLAAGDSSGLITADDFKSPHEWKVSTRSRTLAQSQALYQLAIERMAPLPDGRPGIGVYEELMDAADVTDVEERTNTLAREAALWELDDTWLIEMAKLSVEHEIEVDSGERIPLSSQDPAQLAGAASVPPAGDGTGADGSTPPQSAPRPAGPEPHFGHREAAPLTEPAAGQGGSGVAGT